MARISLDNPAYYLNRDTSWLAFNQRVLEEAQDAGNPLLERLKFLSISASNMDEFFEIRVAAMLQQIEDGYNEAGPDGLTLTQKRDILARLSHEFVDEQYECWNTLRPAMAENGLGLARVMVAVVQEKNHLAADLLLQPPCRLDFGGQEAFGEKPAGLLAEANDGLAIHELITRPGWSGSRVCSARLNPTHAAQPMRLYQR